MNATLTKSLRHFIKCLIMVFLGFIEIGCSQDSTSSTPEKRPILIKGTINDLSRATDSGFENGDAVGIYVVDYVDNITPGILAPQDNHATNVKHLYNNKDNSWSTASNNPLYWKDENTPIDIYGYYPYTSENPASVENYPFTIKTDQTTLKDNTTLSGYEDSDFLWAKTTGATPQEAPVLLTFSHIMSKVVITLIGGAGFEEGLPDSGISVKLVGSQTSATIDLTTGEVTAMTANQPQSISMLKDGTSYKAIVVPQSIDQEISLVEVSIGDELFIYSGTYTFCPNKQHNLTLTLNRTLTKGEILLSSNNVIPWTEDTPTIGEADQWLSERDALIALYKATNGDQWKNNTNWCSDKPLNEWYGIRINANNNVRALELSQNNLTGRIPREIAYLVDLDCIQINMNQITGELPETIQKLSKLSKLDISYNPLCIEFPAFLGNMINLRELYFTNCGLFGRLPEEYSKLVNLNRLDFCYDNSVQGYNGEKYQNKIEGTIPLSWMNMKSLQCLGIYNNQLNEGIPYEMWSSDWWRNLIFQYNTSQYYSDGYVQPLKLLEHKYHSTDYSKEGLCVQLQKASVGNGINIVLIGDNYTDEMINTGLYETCMKNAYNYIFDLKPMNSLRDYFNVYYIVHIDDHIDPMRSVDMEGYINMVKALPDISDPIVSIIAYRPDLSYFRSYTTLYVGEFSSESINFTNSQDGACDQLKFLIHHEVVGHAIGKLADEYLSWEINKPSIPAEEIEDALSIRNSYGWLYNVDFTSDPTKIFWKDFISDSRYTFENIGAYEGCFGYLYGTYKPTENSIMTGDDGYFNAPSRWGIYHQVMTQTGITNDLDSFLQFDNPQTTLSLNQTSNRSYTIKEMTEITNTPRIKRR